MKQEMRISDRSILTTRVFSHGVRKVWRMWSELPLIERWWGPDGFTTRSERFEFSVGGRWVFVMVGPDGREYPNDVEFVAIDPPRSIHYRHLSIPRFNVYVEFRELDPNRTELTFTQVFASKKERDAVAVYAEPANRQIMDKLDALAATLD